MKRLIASITFAVFLAFNLSVWAADLSYVGVGYATSDSANTVTVTRHASTTTGDVVIFLATRNAASSADSFVDDNGATPTTFVREDHEAGTGHTLAIFRRVIQGGDPTTWTFDFDGDTGATRISVVAVTFRDQHADIFDVTPSGSTVVAENNDAGDIAIANITSTVNNSIHVISGAREGGTSDWATPGGYTEIISGWDLNSANTVAYKIIAAAGATGALSFTGTGSGSGITQSFIIKNNTGGGAVSPKLGLLGVGQ